MNPLSIRARSYRTFDELDLHLPEGCVAIVGSNGAGKSSVVNVIDIALFGTESRTLADQLSDDALDENLMLELTFEHAGRDYRVRRTYNGRGRGQTKVDFERKWPDVSDVTDVWHPLTRETAAATQAHVEETIGLSRATFRASSFLAQGDGACFTEAQPRERKRILSEVLGLDLWEKLADRARTDRRLAEDELQRVTATIDYAEQELASQQQVRDERDTAEHAKTVAEQRASTAETELLQLREQHNKALAAAATRAGAERNLETCRQAFGAALTRESELRDETGQLDQRLAARDDLARLSACLENATTERDALQEAVAQAQERERLVIERNRLIRDADASKERSHQLRLQAEQLSVEEEARCVTCGQAIAGEAKERTLATMRADAKHFDDVAHEFEKQANVVAAQIDQLPAVAPDRDRIATLHDLIQRAQNARIQLAALEEAGIRRTAAADERDELLAQMPKFEEAVTSAQTELRTLLADDAATSVIDLERQVRDAEAEVQGWRNSLTAAVQQVARCDERLQRLEKIAADTKNSRTCRDTLHGELDLLATLERAYGRDGIPSLIVENSAIPQIEVEASRILSELGTAYRVELRTERALKSGDGLRDALDVIVIGEAGERAYETFSGGERTRINLALRIALARLLAHRRGAESRVLVVDEPEFLDEPGTAKLAGVLTSLAQSGDFDRVILVSHVPGLKDAFDQVIDVVKDGARSRIVTAKREAVVA